MLNSETGENGNVDPNGLCGSRCSQPVPKQAVDEESPLLRAAPDAAQEHEQQKAVEPLTSVSTVVGVLLVGEFISNADGTLVIAAAGRISSGFSRLQDASWLSTGYTLGLCAAQPMYGKLSDIYGRKPLLVAAYALFVVGCVVSGIGQGFWMVTLGRAVSGIGGGGIMTVGSVIITDIVSKRDVAAWRAYINIAMTLGRSAGGPVGGWLTDAVGWRLLFLIQVPFIILASLLVIIKLRIAYHDHDTITPSKSVHRIDFIGSSLLAASITTLIILLDLSGRLFPWLSWQTLTLGVLGLTLLICFIYVEKSVSPEPIFDLRIVQKHRNVPLSYAISFLQITAQLCLLFSVPLYFQVTQRASTTAAGAHLVPAVVGNTVGGLVAGQFLRTTGRYKVLLVLAGLVASVSYILLYIRWGNSDDDGELSVWESLEIFPGGVGTGIASAASFVSMASLLGAGEIAMATSGFMLVNSFAMTTGVAVCNTVLGFGFREYLLRRVQGDGAAEIIRRATSDTSYIASLEGRVREIVVGCYVDGLKNAYLVSLVCSILGCMLGWAIKQDRL